MSSTLYVAGGWNYRQDIPAINDQLRAAGFNVISTWVEEENGIHTPESDSVDAYRDLQQIAKADAVVSIMEKDGKYPYRGSWVEIGFALGRGKRVIIVCPGEVKQTEDENRNEYTHYSMTNVFFWYPQIEHAKTVEQAIEMLGDQRKRAKN